MGLGDMLTAFQGNPSFSLLGVTKSPTLQRGINGMMGDAASLKSTSSQALSDYITKYLAGTKDASVRSASEIAGVDSLYNGGYANQLAGLRAAQNTATVNAADVATQQAIRGLNAGRLGEQGSGSSYDARTAIGALQPIRVNAALTNANQARTDAGTVTGLQLGNLGVAQNLANANAAYGLAPVDAAQKMFNNNLGNLTGLASVNNANNIFGVQQDKTSLDKWGSFLNAAQSNLYNDVGMGASAIGAMRGAGGGGGGSM